MGSRSRLRTAEQERWRNRIQVLGLLIVLLVTMVLVYKAMTAV